MFVVEGEKDADSLLKLGLTATTCAQGANGWRDEFAECFEGAGLVAVLPDNDSAGGKYAEAVASSLAAHGIPCKVVALPSLPPKGDASDWIKACPDTWEPARIREELLALVADSAERKVGNPTRALIVKAADFLEMKLTPRNPMFVHAATGETVFRERDIGMTYADRGTGKTWIILGKAVALAAGTQFLEWLAPRARRVLLVDGEMPAVDLQERLTLFRAGLATSAQRQLDENLAILSHELNEGGIPSLSTVEGREFVSEIAEAHKADAVLLDNISSLAGQAAENDADEWEDIGHWGIQERARGRAVEWVHHASRGGTARGTSKREDPLDFVVQLKHRQDYTADQGASFCVEFKKVRGLHGKAFRPFDVTLSTVGNVLSWSCELSNNEQQKEEARQLKAEGHSVRKIAELLGIPASTIGGWTKGVRRRKAA